MVEGFGFLTRFMSMVGDYAIERAVNYVGARLAKSCEEAFDLGVWDGSYDGVVGKRGIVVDGELMPDMIELENVMVCNELYKAVVLKRVKDREGKPFVIVKLLKHDGKSLVDKKGGVFDYFDYNISNVNYLWESSIYSKDLFKDFLEKLVISAVRRRDFFISQLEDCLIDFKEFVLTFCSDIERAIRDRVFALRLRAGSSDYIGDLMVKIASLFRVEGGEIADEVVGQDASGSESASGL